MASDGAGIKVLVPALETAHNGYIELYRRDDVAVLQYEPDKAARTCSPSFGSSRNLTCGRRACFNALYESGCGFDRAGCSAHARRKFRDARRCAAHACGRGRRVRRRDVWAPGRPPRNQTRGRCAPCAPDNEHSTDRRRILSWMNAVAPSTAAFRPARPIPATARAGFWHPHRGMETITYVLRGSVEHADNLGNKGVSFPGDVQWITAGSGIIHQDAAWATRAARCTASGSGPAYTPQTR